MTTAKNVEGTLEGALRDFLAPVDLAAVAAAIYTDGPWLTRTIQRWRPYICPFDRVIAEVPRQSFVLDIGCGGGLLLGTLASLGRIVGGIGFDFSRSAIAVADAMTASLSVNHGLSFHHLSVADDWPQGPVTLVTMIDVLHHVPPIAQETVFRQAARSVVPGAQLLYKDIAPRPRWRAWANTIHDLLLARQWVHYVSMPSIELWARAEGLELMRQYRVDRLWYGHQFAVFKRPV